MRMHVYTEAKETLLQCTVWTILVFIYTMPTFLLSL